VPESLPLKREVIKQLDDVAGPDTIIASNSSSYTITEILQNLDVKHRDRFVSLHSCGQFPDQILYNTARTDVLTFRL
jgi:3-hydroxyacyl-CoA dehydrogenase